VATLLADTSCPYAGLLRSFAFKIPCEDISDEDIAAADGFVRVAADSSGLVNPRNDPAAVSVANVIGVVGMVAPGAVPELIAGDPG